MIIVAINAEGKLPPFSFFTLGLLLGHITMCIV